MFTEPASFLHVPITKTSAKYHGLIPQIQLDFLDYHHLISGNQFDYVYQPNDDSFLMLSVLHRQVSTFPKHCTLCQIGSGSGILSAHLSSWLIKSNNPALLHLSIDLNMDASFLSHNYYTHYNLPINQLTTSLFNNIHIDHFQPQIIIFNPPYIPVSQQQLINQHKYLSAKLQHIVKTHNNIRIPQQNLIAYSYIGGIDGLAITRKLIKLINWPCICYFIVMGDDGIRQIQKQIYMGEIVSQGVTMRLQLMQFMKIYNQQLYVLKLTVSCKPAQSQ